jgi:hypothetical protein
MLSSMKRGLTNVQLVGDKSLPIMKTIHTMYGCWHINFAMLYVMLPSGKIMFKHTFLSSSKPFNNPWLTMITNNPMSKE